MTSEGIPPDMELRDREAAIFERRATNLRFMSNFVDALFWPNELALVPKAFFKVASKTGKGFGEMYFIWLAICVCSAIVSRTLGDG